ncbi:MAG: hypothetical protein HYR60_27830 [Acidobacteria bacterium]|nr:hypothetical protein [Acidobacteriota bacterium]
MKLVPWQLLILAAPALAAEPLRVENTDRVGRRVENAVFVADLSRRTVRGREEDSGTLRALTFKRFGVTLLRTQNRMHWAPSLQRSGARSYSGIGTWEPVQTFREEIQPDSYRHYREGYLADYHEVKIEAESRFYAAVPYFLFHSVMTVEKPLSIDLLRNQEMTMDERFTHVAWPGRDGKPRIATFEERKPILAKEPVAVDAPWVCFLNLDKGYGFGAVVLDYKATRSANPITSINDGADNGKYWDRRIINYLDTPLATGDRFEERTAYVLVACTKAEPLREFLDWERRIRAARAHPLKP